MIGYRSVYKSEPKGKADMLQYTITVNGAPITTNFFMSNLVTQLKVASFRNNFNSSLTIGKYVTNCNSLFTLCNNLNKPISVKSVLFPNCSAMFWNCAKFNSPVYIATAENAANMITNCANFNSPVTIGTVNTCPYLLRGSSNFNSTVSIKSAKNLDGIFSSITNGIYNSPFVIPEDTVSCNHSFYGCANYNQPIAVPNSVMSCQHMFAECWALNSTITFASGSQASNFVGMFNNAHNFNQAITIPNKASNINCAWMFYNSGMNRPTVLPSNVTNCFRMYTFSKMNAPVTLLDGSVVGSCANMFENSVYNQDLIVPERISNFAYALYYDNAFSRNIYFKGKTNRNLDLTMCCKGNPAKRKNIFFNIALNSRFNSRYWANGMAYPINWTVMTNGFYSPELNIYCYYNYSG